MSDQPKRRLLPLLAEWIREPPRPPPAPGVTLIRGAKVLLVDADTERADVLRRVLEDADYEVDVVDSVWRALLIVAPTPLVYGVIVADPELWGMSHLGGCLIEGDPPLRFFSKLSETELRRRGHEFASRDLLSEPFSSAAFIQHVEQWMNGGPEIH